MTKQPTPLEALERLRPKTTYLPYYTRSEKRYYCDIIETALKDSEKKSKALEIIKEEIIEFCYTHLDRLLEEKTYTYQDYINWCINAEVREHYTKEQFDLLKEVLK